MNDTITGSPDELQELNAAFKKARKANQSLRYVDYLVARKAAMLEELSKEEGR